MEIIVLLFSLGLATLHLYARHEPRDLAQHQGDGSRPQEGDRQDAQLHRARGHRKIQAASGQDAAQLLHQVPRRIPHRHPVKPVTITPYFPRKPICELRRFPFVQIFLPFCDQRIWALIRKNVIRLLHGISYVVIVSLSIVVLTA